MSIDGTCLDVADSQVNEQAFGRPGSARGEKLAAFPQLRMVGLAECGTHALFSVAIGPLSDDERTLTGRLLGALGPGMLCLADRGFYSFELWNQARATGAQLVWRTKSNHRLAVNKRLDDGSYLSELFASADRQRSQPVAVRVVEYELDDPGRPANETRYRLLTTILNPDQAPAAELAPLYAERWEFESALDELKVHQRGPRVVLRSKTPDGVIQELYGHLCVHVCPERRARRCRRSCCDSCCAGDGGRPSGFAVQAGSPNRRGVMPVKSRGGKRPRKRPAVSGSGVRREDEHG